MFANIKPVVGYFLLGETSESYQQPKTGGNSLELEKCCENTCCSSSCSNNQEQTVKGTILVREMMWFKKELYYYYSLSSKIRDTFPNRQLLSNDMLETSFHFWSSNINVSLEWTKMQNLFLIFERSIIINM